MKKLIAFLTFTLCSLFFCHAQITVVHTFAGTDGQGPIGDVLFAKNTLYGMTEDGGVNGTGAIFSVDTTGNNFKVLYSFSGSMSDGWYPFGSFIISGKTLFGMTLQGGGVNDGGTVFSIDTNGNNYKTLYSFSVNPNNGESPYGNLTLLGTTLYGMTFFGGTNNDGVIFALDTTGNNYRILYNFALATGSSPQGSLTPSLNGKVLYGMTDEGGTKDSGVIFSVDTNGSNYKVLYNFGGNNGAYPLFSSLTLGGKMLYGLTREGGVNFDGVIFSLDTNGSNYKVLANFDGNDGAAPNGSLILNGAQLLGLTTNGLYGNGSIFSIDTDGNNFADLYDFYYANNNGTEPRGSFTAGGGNQYYGMTAGGGPNGDGVVFKFDNTLSGINQIKPTEGSCTAYPNPSNGVFTFAVKSEELRTKSTIDIYNILGENIYSKQFSTSHSQLSIDISNQPSGLYMCRVLAETGEVIGSCKVVIEK